MELILGLILVSIGLILVLGSIFLVFLYGKLQTAVAVTEIANEAFKQSMLVKADLMAQEKKVNDALAQAAEANQRSGAIERWTHSLVTAPASPDLLKKVEEQARAATGLGNEDFLGDLNRHGFSTDDTDELV